MKRFVRHLSVLLVVLLAVSLSMIGVQAQDGGRIRFVHVIPGASAVDVYTNEQLTVAGLTYGSASTYVNAPSGDHTLVVRPAGTDNDLWEQTITVTPGSALTLIAATASDSTFLVYPDNLDPVEVGNTRVTAIHAISGGPAVDVLLDDGQTAFSNLEFGVPGGTLDVPAFAFSFVITPTGEGLDGAIFAPEPTPLNSGTSHMLVVYGSVDDPQWLNVSQATSPAGESGFVRVIHGVSGAPAVDIYANDTLLIPSLAFGAYTEHVAVPVGDYALTIRAAGADEDLLEAELAVANGDAVTITALGTPSDIRVQAFSDDIAGISESQARVSVVNGIPGTARLNAAVDGEMELASNLGFGEAAEAISLNPIEAALGLTLTEGTNSNEVDLGDQSFYGGVYYNVVAVNDAGEIRVITAPTGLAQGIASAPGAAEMVVAQAATPVPTEAPASTLPPVATPLPAEPAAATPAPVVASGTGISATVFNLNADSNLQLRQYPDSAALSLATVAPGTVLGVNGRAGALEEIPTSATQVPEDYEYVDPATLLTGNEDLVTEETWLNVTYATPDGGLISAWANALYLNVRNDRGERVRLAGLPTVAANLPGSVENSAVTPPPVPANVVAATVFNLDPGVNLNLRRTPDTGGEVLVRVQNGTTLAVLGINETLEWAFVQYNPPEGGSVTGWSSVTYLQYSYNGRNFDLEGLQERDLLPTLGDDVRGEVGDGASVAVLPTVDPVRNQYVARITVNSDANLNLRRNPDENSEVLAQVPGGSQVIITARTDDEQWLQTSYEGVEGWIAAGTDTFNFIVLTFNGRPATVSDIPLEGEAPLAPVSDGTAPEPEGEEPAEEGEPSANPTLELDSLPVRVTDAVVAMTGSPGGSGDGLPVLTAGINATLLFTDGSFSYIELEDGTRGWVPAGAVQPR
jgi:uncharacterized protein YgiM (DUF1202 family)